MALSGRVVDGCLDAVSTPTGPLARTPAELRENLTAAPRARAFATGTAAIASGGPIPAGRYPVRLEVGPQGSLRLVGLPRSNPEPVAFRSDVRSYAIGFAREGDHQTVVALHLAGDRPAQPDLVSWIQRLLREGRSPFALRASTEPSSASVGQVSLSLTR